MANIKSLHHLWVKGKLGYWGSEGLPGLIQNSRDDAFILSRMWLSLLFYSTFQWFSPRMWLNLLTFQFSNLSSTFHLKLLIPSPFSMLPCPFPNFISYYNSHGCPPFLIMWKINPFGGFLRGDPRYTCPKLPRSHLAPEMPGTPFPSTRTLHWSRQCSICQLFPPWIPFCWCPIFYAMLISSLSLVVNGLL